MPLENAYFRGFYEKMVIFIRSLLESGLKTNDYLQFAVITGCYIIENKATVRQTAKAFGVSKSTIHTVVTK